MKNLIKNFDLSTVEPNDVEGKRTIHTTAVYSKLSSNRNNVLEPDKNHEILLIWQQ